MARRTRRDRRTRDQLGEPHGTRGAGTYETDTFDIDDISLDAADAPTGQRTVALAKCKRKRRKKKCRKRAAVLPV